MITALGISLVVNVIAVCMFLFIRSEVANIRKQRDQTNDRLLHACVVLASSSYWLVATTTEGHQVKADVHQTIREIEEFLELPEGDRAYLGDEAKSSNVN